MKRIAFLCLALALPLWAQYEITWSTLDAGGGAGAGGAYTLAGTVGQPDAGTASGGPYTLTGGFWSAFAEAPPEAPPALHIQLFDNRVLLSWPNPSTGYLLQQSASLTTPNWADVNAVADIVGSEKQVMVVLQPDARYFRLRKP